MAQEQSASGARGPARLNRVFEQPADAIALYSDLGQVMGTGQEVLLQFYETIPGPPGSKGMPEVVRSRLRVTITLSKAHAANIGRLLLQHGETGGPPAASDTRQESEQ